MASIVNVLLDTFPGLALPPTICIPLSSSTSTSELLHHITALLPRNVPCSTRLILTTTCRKHIDISHDVTLTDYVEGADDILPLRLSVPLCGGKGGFGSQLRAAGGRMSSKKRRQNAELATGSARNLDGRRLRTITEAKNLAAYLATKPEMDRKEKEERRKRWEQVVELAEQRETDMRSGKGADGRRKGLSDEWMETKEEVGENVRNAVKIAMMSAEAAREDDTSGSGGSATGSEDDSDIEDVMELDDDAISKLKAEAEAGDDDAVWVLKNKLKIPSQYLPSEKPKAPSRRRFAGFDDDGDWDDDSGSSSGEDDDALRKHKGKGKAKVVPE